MFLSPLAKVVQTTFGPMLVSIELGDEEFVIDINHSVWWATDGSRANMARGFQLKPDVTPREFFEAYISRAEVLEAASAMLAETISHLAVTKH